MLLCLSGLELIGDRNCSISTIAVERRTTLGISARPVVGNLGGTTGCSLVVGVVHRDVIVVRDLHGVIQLAIYTVRGIWAGVANDCWHRATARVTAAAT